MSVYVDTSALIPLFVPESSSETVTGLVTQLKQQPLLSDYGAGEFASAIARLVREGGYDEANGRTILAGFDRWIARSAELIAIRPGDLRRAAGIVRRFELKLRFPDALHIAVCLERALSLVTRDRLMASGAKHLGLSVELFD